MAKESIRREQVQDYLQRRILSRLTGMDGLRGICVLLLMITFLPYQRIYGLTYSAVSFLFILFGFLLAYQVEQKSLTQPFTILGYYKKYIKRLYPSVLAMVGITLAVFGVTYPEVLISLHKSVIAVLLGVSSWWHIILTPDGMEEFDRNNPFKYMWIWSITFQYLLIWPFLYAVYGKISNRWKDTGELIAMCVLFVISLGLAYYGYMQCMAASFYQYDMRGMDLHLYELLLGSTTGLMVCNQKKTGEEEKKHTFIGYMVLFSTILMGVLFKFESIVKTKEFTLYLMYILPIFMAFVVQYIVSHSHLISQVLDNPILSWIGKRSFIILLWFYPISNFFGHMWFMQGRTGRPYEDVYIVISTFLMAALFEYIRKGWMAMLDGKELGTMKRRCIVGLSTVVVILTAWGFISVWQSPTWESLSPHEIQQIQDRSPKVIHMLR